MAQEEQAHNSFPATDWVLLGKLKVPGERDAAVDALCRTYWKPLYLYARKLGLKHEDAEDITQTFFYSHLSRAIFAEVSPERGRLRGFLTTSFQNLLKEDWRKRYAKKRGGGMERIPLHEAEAEYAALAPETSHLSADDFLDYFMARQLLDQAMEDLAVDSDSRDARLEFRLLKDHLPSRAKEKRREENAREMEAIAEQLRISPGSVRNNLRRMRLRYRQFLLNRVGTTLEAPTPEAVQDELARLAAALAKAS